MEAQHKLTENRPAFTAQLPPAVRYCEQLCPTAKLLFCEISALTLAEGFCWAKNEHFSILFDLSRDRISRLISSLKSAGFIDTKLDKSQANYREIYVLPAAFMGCKSPASSVISPIVKNNKGYCYKEQGVLLKKTTGIVINDKSYKEKNIKEKYKGKGTPSFSSSNSSSKHKSFEQMDIDSARENNRKAMQEFLADQED